MHEDVTLAIKVQPEVREALAWLAAEHGLTLPVYLRLVMERQSRTPLKIALRRQPLRLVDGERRDG
jgi:hypothetical protein